MRQIRLRHAALALLCAASSAHAATLLGIYYGNQGWKMDQVRALETWQGKKHAVVNLFTDWTNTTKVMNNLFSQQLPNIWNNGNVPMISWEPFTDGLGGVRRGAGRWDVQGRADQLPKLRFIQECSSRLCIRAGIGE